MLDINRCVSDWGLCVWVGNSSGYSAIVGSGRFSNKRALPDSQIYVVDFLGTIEFNPKDITESTISDDLHFGLFIPTNTALFRDFAASSYRATTTIIGNSHLLTPSSSFPTTIIVTGKQIGRAHV